MAKNKSRIASYVIPEDLRKEIVRMAHNRMFGTNRSAYIRYLVKKDIEEFEKQLQKG